MGGSARFATGGRASGKALLRRVGPALPCVAEPVAKLRIWRQDCGEACHLRRGPRQGFPAEAHSKGLAREVGPVATQGLATGCRARGKALPRRPGPRRGLATDDRARRKELPRTAGPWPWAPEPVATLCQSSGRALPRAAWPAAAFRGGRPGPWQGCAAGGRARGKASTRALPRAAGSVARPCTRCQTRGMPATNLCQGPRARAASSQASPRAAGPATRLGPVAKPCHGPVAIARQARRKVFSLAAQARLCHGARWPWLVFATDNRTRGKAAPRSWRSAAVAVASPCHGRPAPRQGLSTAAPWHSLSANVAADDKGAPRPAGSVARPGYGAGLPWQGPDAGLAALCEALPRAAGLVARRCRGQPTSRQGVATWRGLGASGLCQLTMASLRPPAAKPRHGRRATGGKALGRARPPVAKP